MIRKRFLAPLLLLALASTAAFAEPYNDSDPDDYITERFDVRAVANADHTIDISETIMVDFVQEHHGITRYIPIASDHTYDIENLTVNGYKFSTKKEDGYEVIYAGDADKYVTGQHAYNITYTLRYYADKDDTADFLAQNIFPTGWDTSVREASLSLTMPSPIDWSQLEIYGGAYGSTDSRWNEYFTYNVDGGSNTIYIEGHDIPKKFGLTLRDTQLPDGYWQGAQPFELPLGIITPVFGAFAALMAAASIGSWFKFGRSPRLVKPVEFYPPDELTPAEIGFALDDEVDNEEMMSMVLYFADKGYLRIHEYQKKRYEFIKEKDIPGSEPDFAVHLFNGLFAKNDIVTARSVPSSFYSKLQKSKEMLAGEFREKHGYVYSSASAKARLLIGFLTVLLAFLFPLLGNYVVREISNGAIIGCFNAAIMLAAVIFLCGGVQHKRILRILIGAIAFLICMGITYLYMYQSLSRFHAFAAVGAMTVMLIFTALTHARTDENASLVGRISGFKEFIRTAEIDKLKALMATDPQYCYRILPYAAVLGLDTAWAKKLTKIEVPKPYWYDPYDDGRFVYSTAWCRSMTRDCIHGSVPLKPDHSSGGGSYSGGSSGGGFSGGGGGGGGGGAW